MKSDEGFSKISDKTIIIQLVNENVIPFTRKNSKRAVSTALFFACYKNLQITLQRMFKEPIFAGFEFHCTRLIVKLNY